ncbi:MAG: sugar transferase [Firmicutes bacterium]|nr:sugar transferase [Bacillota bacterium]
MYPCVKRATDVIVAGLGILVLLPLIILIALTIRISMGAPVFFKQERAGLHEKPFILYKFRTMTNEYGPEGTFMPDALRLTRVGSFLRKTSLDELPQLWNVLKGDMSLVGPRPLYMSYLPYYTEKEKLRHTVRPGITGWAQVNGRNTVMWDERLELDVDYVIRRSVMLDLNILIKTFKNVVTSKNVVVIPGKHGGPLDKHRKNQMQL